MTTPILGNELRGAKPVAIDVDNLASGRLLISAMSGGGKSFALRRVLEQTYGHIPQIIIDREGEFYTLRDGRDYLLIGGDDADIPVNVDVAESLAPKLLKSGANVIIDIEPLAGMDRYEYVRRFLTGLIDAPKEVRKPVMIVIDEAHQFAPERGKPESRHKMIELASLGRKRGLVPVFATQRIAKLAKDVAAECASRMIGLTTLDVDIRRSTEELGFARRDRMILKKLKAGQFFVYGPAFSADVKLIQVGPVSSHHIRPGEEFPPVAEPGPMAKAAREMLKGVRLHQQPTISSGFGLRSSLIHKPGA